MKKLVCIILAVLLILAAGCGKAGKHHAEIEIENYGTIKVELDAKSAPITGMMILSVSPP